MAIDYQELLKKAIEVSLKSYSPYSSFPVGAALLVENDQGEEVVFSGCNIENSSYSLGICAERAAVSQAISLGYKKFKAVAIIARNLKPCNPCGACLQVLTEFSTSMEIILENSDGTPNVRHIREFLPLMFTPDLLIKSSPLFSDKNDID